MRLVFCVFSIVLAGFLNSPAVFANTIVLTGFESGNLSGWTFTGQGNAKVLTSIGNITPLYGTKFAMLSNGPDNQGGAFDRAQLLSDPFFLASGDILSFATLRLTAEFTGVLADVNHLDSFSIQLVPVVAGSTLDLSTSDVADTAFNPISLGPISAPGGDTFFDSTGWTTFSRTGLSGNYRLSFVVRDGGDNNFDSAFLIDGNVATIPAAEPSSALTVMVGLAALVLAKHLTRIEVRR